MFPTDARSGTMHKRETGEQARQGTVQRVASISKTSALREASHLRREDPLQVPSTIQNDYSWMTIRRNARVINRTKVTIHRRIRLQSLLQEN
jgi:hypothetical protein